MKKGIVIYWDCGPETILGDFDNPESLEQLTKSSEWWIETKHKAEYNISPELVKKSSTQYELHIEYSAKQNPQIEEDKVCWGQSTIFFNPQAMTGKAKWVGREEEDYNGTVTWERLDAPLIGEKRKQTVTKLQRAQKQFRDRLISIRPECAISGETTLATLDAAHIIPAKDGGQEVRANGLLLRTDLHRLYDHGCFQITPDGTIEVLLEDELSIEYKRLLKDKVIPEDILNNIKPALIEKERLDCIAK